MLQPIELKARRIHLKLTQAEFLEQYGDKLGIKNREYYSRFESGAVPIGKEFEKRYNAVFGTRRLIETHTERGVSCPYCDSEHGSYRVYVDSPDSPTNDIYKCRDCQQTFPVHVAWHMTKVTQPVVTVDTEVWKDVDEEK